MSFANKYRRKMQVLGGTKRDRNYNRKSQEFELYYRDTLNKEDCLIDGAEASAVFQDHSQSNNKDLSDDKYIIVPNMTKIHVGSYVEWRNANWLVFTEEYKTIRTHQQLKIRHTNQKLKWLTDIDNQVVCNSGEGWDAYVQNQTLYTLGVSFAGDNFPLANAKMSVFIQDNKETRAVKVGTRIFIAGQVYKIEFADYVSRTGLVNWLLDEDTKNPERDNFDLEIADYWKGKPKEHTDINKNDKNESASLNTPNGSPKEEKTKNEWLIEGEKRIRLGRSYVYSVKGEGQNGPEVTEWILGDIEELPFYILEKDNHSISIKVKDDFRLVGHTSTIAAKVDGEIKNIAVKVIKKFG